MKVLYADDEEHIRDVVEMAFEFEDDIELVTCADGKAALEILREGAFKPDVFLCDVMMVGTDGPTAVRALRADPELSGTPVIFFTAKARPHEHAELMALGPLGIITKPFDTMGLAAAVRALVENSLVHREAEKTQSPLQALTEKFRARCSDEAKAIAAFLSGKTQDDDLLGILHRIAGSGATFGYPDLSVAAGELETAVRDTGDADRARLKQLHDRLVAVSSGD
jgi:two-component system OmpR family response regulator